MHTHTHTHIVSQCVSLSPAVGLTLKPAESENSVLTHFSDLFYPLSALRNTVLLCVCVCVCVCASCILKISRFLSLRFRKVVLAVLGWGKVHFKPSFHSCSVRQGKQQDASQCKCDIIIHAGAESQRLSWGAVSTSCSSSLMCQSNKQQHWFVHLVVFFSIRLWQRASD